MGCSSKSESPSPSPSASSGTSGSSSSPQGSSGSSGSSSGSSSGNASPSADPKKGNIAAGGSTALQPLLTQAAGTFKSDKGFTGVIAVDGGSSGQGLSDVAAGKTDIGASDVAPEQLGLDGTGLVDHQVAIVAVGVAATKDVSENLTDISVADLKGIFTGKITDWKQVTGWKGESLPVTAYYYKAGSGIRYIFDTYGINSTLTDEQLGSIGTLKIAESPVGLSKLLGTEKGAIGYTALPYCPDLSLLKVDGVEANYDNVYSGKYKLWGCGHLYTKGEPKGAVKEFIDYLSNQDFQKKITSGGYGIISEMKVSR
jgi:phosphate transport system substrate-binding protein